MLIFDVKFFLPNKCEDFFAGTVYCSFSRQHISDKVYYSRCFQNGNDKVQLLLASAFTKVALDSIRTSL